MAVAGGITSQLAMTLASCLKCPGLRGHLQVKDQQQYQAASGQTIPRNHAPVRMGIVIDRLLVLFLSHAQFVADEIALFG